MGVAPPMDAATIAIHRSDRDHYFGTHPQSPLPFEYRNSFTGLNYYDWNPALAVPADLGETEGADVGVATSDGGERVYRLAAHVTVSIAGTQHRLAAFDTGRAGLFLPFRDTTSGRETYGGGRYLDLPPAGDGTVIVDFNLAYSPFCAYNDSYSCVLPPVENWLSVPIEAGEKTWRRPV